MTTVSRFDTAVGQLAVATQGSGPPAVLWHSLFVDDRSWDAVADDLAPHRTLIRITGPGHGASSALTAPFSLDDCADAAGEVLQAFEIEQAVDWVGNGWGGHVGLVLAARQPPRVRTLTTFNTPVAALTREQRKAPRLAKTLLSTVGAVRPLRDGIASALLSPQARAERPGLVAYVHDCLRSADRRALAHTVRSISLDRPDLTPLLSSIVARSVMVTGSDDELWTLDQARAAASRMPNAVAEEVSGSAHLTPLERPDEAARIILQHWSDI
ncbi:MULTISPECIES: alpha/beta fold hydrolase [Microbacterium]|uniref:Pimeloyl-ACP methyl ester carboxylesterase n=1 Tax=Microbacterium saccharophilum TaxID=1213358 RepID=A0A7Z7CYG4_9MICO|nr:MULTISPECIES: alpha/beta fold hydrolase [Microbacterium]SFI59580.1 Pimeloyl-ACP methyl ester carboxylesterase [Microbacterium saccharophilum]